MCRSWTLRRHLLKNGKRTREIVGTEETREEEGERWGVRKNWRMRGGGEGGREGGRNLFPCHIVHLQPDRMTSFQRKLNNKGSVL